MDPASATLTTTRMGLLTLLLQFNLGWSMSLGARFPLADLGHILLPDCTRGLLVRANRGKWALRTTFGPDNTHNDIGVIFHQGYFSEKS